MLILTHVLWKLEPSCEIESVFCSHFLEGNVNGMAATGSLTVTISCNVRSRDGGGSS